jgi:hypothetical protein
MWNIDHVVESIEREQKRKVQSGEEDGQDQYTKKMSTSEFFVLLKFVLF